MILPGVGSSALRMVPVSDSVMKTERLSGPPYATLVVIKPVQDRILAKGSPRGENC